MEKELYLEPEMKVVLLKLSSNLLVGSDVDEETGEAPFDPDGKD